MKLPTRLAVALTTAITGLMALSAEVQITHTLHVVCLIVGGLVLGLIVEPGGTATVNVNAPPYQVGAIPAAPPAPAPPAPQSRSLP